MVKSFYAKVAFLGFAMGAGMEMFMIKTGFYEKVVEIEAERIEQAREDKQAFLSALKEEMEQRGKS